MRSRRPQQSSASAPGAYAAVQAAQGLMKLAAAALGRRARSSIMRMRNWRHTSVSWHFQRLAYLVAAALGRGQ